MAEVRVGDFIVVGGRRYHVEFRWISDKEERLIATDEDGGDYEFRVGDIDHIENT